MLLHSNICSRFLINFLFLVIWWSTWSTNYSFWILESRYQLPLWLRIGRSAGGDPSLRYTTPPHRPPAHHLPTTRCPHQHRHRWGITAVITLCQYLPHWRVETRAARKMLSAWVRWKSGAPRCAVPARWLFLPTFFFLSFTYPLLILLILTPLYYPSHLWIRHNWDWDKRFPWQTANSRNWINKLYCFASSRF